jgi:hypothetical protein
MSVFQFFHFLVRRIRMRSVTESVAYVFVVGMAAAAVIMAPPTPSVSLGDTITYSFNGSAQGWTSIDLQSPSSGEPWVWTAGNPGSTAWTCGAPQHGADGDESYVYPGLSSWGDNATIFPQDNAHSTRIFRSPQFKLDATGDITLYLAGGHKPGGTPVPTSFAAVPTSTSSTGFLGVTLRDTATGTYVASTYRAAPSRDNWESLTMSLTGVDRSKTYTLDYIDAKDTSWGWSAMDGVSIPGSTIPEPSVFVLLSMGVIGLLAYAWRKRS